MHSRTLKTGTLKSTVLLKILKEFMLLFRSNPINRDYALAHDNSPKMSQLSGTIDTQFSLASCMIIKVSKIHKTSEFTLSLFLSLYCVCI